MIDIRYNNSFLVDAKSAFNSVIVFPQTASFFDHKPFYIPIPTNLSIEMRLDNRVRIYKDKHIITLLAQLVIKYLFIWKSESFVQIPLKLWIKIPLKPGWETKVYAIKPKIYSLGNMKTCQLV